MRHLIFVVDADPVERRAVANYLREQGFRAKELSYSKAPEDVAGEAPDLLVLAIPPEDVRQGVISQWSRLYQQTPILALGHYDEPNLRVMILDAGADDFIVQPYKREELRARIAAIIRRTARIKSFAPDSRIEIGGLTVDLNARRVFIDQRDIRLTRTEFSLLSELVRRVDAVCTHEELLAKVWGGEYWDANHYLHVYLGRLRKKMGPKYGGLLQTVPRMGYMLNSSSMLATAAAHARPA
ncbi:MAG: response regulator transcription factor [Anaerolineae bacterium]|nr:response regulator transcription factor [Anaerolineae bacterium]